MTQLEGCIQFWEGKLAQDRYLMEPGTQALIESTVHHLKELEKLREEVKQPLITAAPELLEACKAQHQAIDILFAKLIQLDKTFFPSKSGQPWEAVVKGNAAITKAEPKVEVSHES